MLISSLELNETFPSSLPLGVVGYCRIVRKQFHACLLSRVAELWTKLIV